jgi:hypothetical protein
MPGELAAIFRSLAADTSEAADSIATAIGRFTVATADTEDANVARTLAADADSARAIAAIPGEADILPGGWSGAGFVEASTPEAEAAYAAIRANPGDVARIAANTGINEDVLAQAKAHLFMTTHDVPIGPGQITHGYFTAVPDTARLWARAEAGPLTESDQEDLHSLMAHEYVESHLMAAGMPYRSADPEVWVDGAQEFNTKHFGAHEVAPKSSNGSLDHWRRLGLTPPDTPLAPDLSNIDNVVEAARRGLHL